MNKIDKIRAEIEHRIKANKTKNGFPAGTLCAARIEVYEDLISFINSIPEEPDKSLEEEIKKYIDEYGYERGEDKLLIAIVARHFAKWGADHTPLPEDTVIFNKGVEEGRRMAEEEQADLFTIVALDAAQRAQEQQYQKDRAEFAKLKAKEWSDGYDEGIAKGKEQMMKEARNHFVYNVLWGNDMKKMIGIYNDEVSCKPGDVVRVIVLPKEEPNNG